jgi:omega-amidase
MPKNLRITIVQSSLLWEDPAKNLQNFNKQLKKIQRNETDLVVLPEMFTTGFSMQPEGLAEEPGGPTMQWMQEVARALNCAVCGSLMIREKNKFFNRFIWMTPTGVFQSYDKRHLFRMGGEDKVYQVGRESIVIDYKGWVICPQVCYDLRFPVWSRNRMVRKGKNVHFDYDILLYVANWPVARKYAWQHLLIARAIENQCYVAGVNRIGVDGNNLNYAGDSVILNPFGEKISKTKTGMKSVETITISKTELDAFRKKFPVFFDADKFEIK